MLISTVLTLLNLGVFIVSVALIAQVFPIRHWPLARWLVLLVAVLCVISFSTLSVYVHSDYESKVFFSRMRFIGLGLIAPSWVLFLSQSFKVWRFLSKPWLLLILFIPGVLTSGMAVLPSTQDLVITNFSAIQVAGLHLVRFENGAWFPVHYLWSVCLTLVAFAIGLRIFVSGKHLHRRQVSILMVGSAMSLIIDVYCVLTGSDWRWAMLPAGTYSFTVAAIAIGAFKYRFLASALIDMQKVYLHSPDPVIVVDGTGSLVSFNPVAKEIFALNEQDIGLLMTEVMSSLPDQKGEFEWTSKNGTHRNFELSRRSLDSAHDDVGSYLFLRDVTEYKTIGKRLSEDMEFRTKLMALIAHDMFGHVQNQVALSEYLRRVVPSDSTGVVERMLQSATASQDLMRNLIEWSRTQSMGFQMIERPFEVNVLQEEVLCDVRSLFEAKNIQIEFSSNCPCLIVMGDSQMIGTAVRNLLTNSLRATSEGGKVLLRLDSRCQEYVISVEDNGRGMSEIERLSLLQGGARRDRQEGSRESSFSPNGERGFGIGFSMVHHFVRQHQGRVEIESETGKGTRVNLILPLKVPSREFGTIA